jgi:hypothetical protein
MQDHSLTHNFICVKSIYIFRLYIAIFRPNKYLVCIQ